ncbi:Cytochrome c553 [Loktanella sp. DSM 29012]|uniref:c-type cytochrome n=1 Tax=Loktanella sp. DSM 29012 TaxID=1881056 RepID=UPI0008CE76AA|nr:c-type cytochrome [Loktanella sp. DSM 29012]SEQ37315.1 Cytochrome c553 [Loktanella sp. DSM 29012]
MFDQFTRAFWKKFFAVVAAAGVVVGILGVAAISLGLMPISARTPHMQVTTQLLHFVFKRSTARTAEQFTAPDDLMSPERIALGMQHYNNVCSSCHGGPELGQSPIALSQRPRPQHLPAVVDQFSDEQLYVILRNGVKFSAMPSWPADSNFDEIWSVVAFIRNLPNMTAEEYIAGTTRTMPEGAPALPFEAPVALGPMDRGPQAYPIDEYLYAAPGTGWHEYASNNDIIATCTSCHGADGSGSPTLGLAPNLTVQSADYLAKALREYASGARPSGIMMTVAASLTNDQIDGLAAYYDSLPDVPSPQDQASAADLAAGEQIALMGKPDVVIPACYTCHQNIAAQANMVVPGISGQSEAYLRNKLDQFATGTWYGDGAWQPMGHISQALTPEDRANLAAYFAAQPAGETAPALTMATADLANAETIVGQVCAECHTESGVGVDSGEFPNLTIQTATYLAQQLRAFHARERDNETMSMVAGRLSDQDKTDLAQYFGNAVAQPSPAPSDPFATAAEITNGQLIAQNGIADKNIPACLSCHGAEPTEDLPIVGRLHGQAGRYIENRLQALGSDANTGLYSLSPMHGIARDMNVQERHDVAAWFAAQDPLPK